MSSTQTQNARDFGIYKPTETQIISLTFVLSLKNFAGSVTHPWNPQSVPHKHWQNTDRVQKSQFTLPLMDQKSKGIGIFFYVWHL